MTAADILRDSLELLSDPAHWTKGASARDADGEPVNPWDPSAVCWCATGAPYRGERATPRSSTLAVQLLTRALHRQQPVSSIFVSAYNDHPDCTHAEIIALYKRALALAEKAEAER